LFRDEDVETLMKLGLTLLQAKTYLTLSILDTATMHSISKTSNIARQDVYRVMPILQKLGLAEKMIVSPATYKATPVRDGVSLLLQQRKEEYTKLQTKANVLLNSIQEIGDEEVEEDENQFAIIYDRALLYKKFDKGNRTSEKSIECSGTWQDIKNALFSVLEDNFKKATKRGVRVRIVTENPGPDKSADKILCRLCRSPLFEIRHVPSPIPVKIVLYDGKEVHTSISTSNETDMPSLWSTNPNFVKIMTNQFEEMWNKGIRFPKEKSRVARNKS
jgi:sugar-specific transcriptional regulator TrmB